MSALGLDDMNDSHGVLAYAPRKPRRADDETSIRPVLERLARSEGRVPGPRLVRKAAVEDMPPPPVETTGAKSVFPMTARRAGASRRRVVAAEAGADLEHPASGRRAAASNDRQGRCAHAAAGFGNACASERRAGHRSADAITGEAE